MRATMRSTRASARGGRGRLRRGGELPQPAQAVRRQKQVRLILLELRAEEVAAVEPAGDGMAGQIGRGVGLHPLDCEARFLEQAPHGAFGK